MKVKTTRISVELNRDEVEAIIKDHENMVGIIGNLPDDQLVNRYGHVFYRPTGILVDVLYRALKDNTGRKIRV